MFSIYLLILTFVTLMPQTRQSIPDTANEKEKDKILAKWLGVELDGAYFFDWPAEEDKQEVAASEEQQEEIDEQKTIYGPWPEGNLDGFVSDPPDDCFPIQRESRRSTEDFMRFLQQKCWDDLLPVSLECSAHSGAEHKNAPKAWYLFLAHVFAFFIVAQLLHLL